MNMSSQLANSTRRKSLRTIDLKNSLEPNAGLYLDKYILHQDKKKKEARRDHVRDVAEISIFNDYENILKRWEMMLAAHKNSGYAVKRGKATVQGRMVLGTGNESVLETAVTLHRTYGVPYIPGSALKGLAASLARQDCGDDWIKTSENYNTVFGNTAESGCLVFFDALYMAEKGISLARNPLKRDVLTPHHREYYMGSAPPADWDDPKPVHFLSATGSYLVAIAASAGGEDWLNAVWEILEYALTEVGIGAKTSSGYGRLKLE
jgi:CRISPR-associated protein Cmr6